MHMVGHAADCQRLHVILTRDAAEIRPEPFANRGREPRTTFLGGEYAMYQAGVEGMHNGFKSNSFIENSPANLRVSMRRV